MIIASIYPCPYDPQIRHDLNAALIRDDDIYAYEEDKLTGIKNEYTVQFPERSLMMGCKELGVAPRDVDVWVLPTPREPPRMEIQFMFFATLIKAYEGGFEDFESWYRDHVRFVDHHICHASAAIQTSGFEECAFVSQDGGGDMGDPRDMIFGEYSDGKLDVIGEHKGLYNICSYHAFVTDACGFGGGENGKTSGLASYGTVQPSLLDALRTLIRVDGDGLTFDRERYSRTLVNLRKVRPQEYDRNKIFLQVPSETNVLRMAAGYLPQDIAATGEALLQEVFLKFLERVKSRVRSRKIVFSGGLFQNVALNRAIAASGMFDACFFPMASSDAGLALGAALKVKKDIELETGKAANAAAPMPLSAFVGPSYPDAEIEALLDRFRLRYAQSSDPSEEAAELLSAGNVVGWFQGRAEHGPRSLGARSILADPRSLESKQRVNQRLKRRDWFMPYAPSILEEHFEDWCESPVYSPYMQIAFTVPEGLREKIPAAVHVDGTSRINVVRKTDNPGYWRLIDGFRRRTGLPIVLNTSFNRHGIPTISSPRQAIEHLMEGCMDYLVIGQFVVRFADNRRTPDVVDTLMSEDDLLVQDCIDRIPVVARMGTAADLSNYLERLSRLVGAPVRFDDGQVSIVGRKPVSVGAE
jgi:carbamoyltransferase